MHSTLQQTRVEGISLRLKPLSTRIRPLLSNCAHYAPFSLLYLWIENTQTHKSVIRSLNKDQFTPKTGCNCHTVLKKRCGRFRVICS
ncbi:unnamed protein product [Lactuca virosa]|uniref:Uncharacterized protein n=1 Tax=Lactuca virosa TaxID=75947 RepID=A0AAU9N1H7_9ASTR|nr:unnamed protein product [Lactuca virosa]